MTVIITVDGALWSHHCMGCGDLFDAILLDDPCPQCGLRDRRETMSLVPFLHRKHGVMLTDSWITVMACGRSGEKGVRPT